MKKRDENKIQVRQVHVQTMYPFKTHRVQTIYLTDPKQKTKHFGFLT